jgi:hypothetical protein
MSIVGTFPVIIQNGQPEDATVVMQLFAWIQSQVNGNACPATTTTNVLKGDGVGGTTAAISGVDFLPPNADYGVTTGSANAYLVTLNQTLMSLTDGQKIRVKASFANSGASTINVNSLGVKKIVNYYGGDLIGGEIANLGDIELTYNSNFASGAGAWVITTPVAAVLSTTNFSLKEVSGLLTLTYGGATILTIDSVGTVSAGT